VRGATVKLYVFAHYYAFIFKSQGTGVSHHFDVHANVHFPMRELPLFSPKLVVRANNN